MHEDELGVIELLRRRIGFDVAMFNRPGGIATGALRTLCDLAKSKLHADRPVALRDEPGTRVGIARMHAQLAAARLLLRHAVTDAWSAA